MNKDYTTVIEDIINVLNEADGDYVSQVYNSICSDSIEYVGDSEWSIVDVDRENNPCN